MLSNENFLPVKKPRRDQQNQHMCSSAIFDAPAAALSSFTLPDRSYTFQKTVTDLILNLVAAVSHLLSSTQL